jgi:carbon-monoxide dehydrogenase large subunit
MAYDSEGQPTSGSFMDYCLAQAPEIPPIELMFRESPTPSNPLGVKGVGELGIVPAVAAVISAVEHALEPFGARIDRAPATPRYLIGLIRKS